MDPSSLLFALQLVGTGLEIAGGISQARAQSRAGREQARAIEYETELERRATERRARQILARNRATAAGAGVDPFSGTPLEFELANAFELGMNQSLTQYSGDVRARQARLGAAQARGQIPGIVGKGLLQGGSILGKWYSGATKNTNTITLGRLPGGGFEY